MMHSRRTVLLSLCLAFVALGLAVHVRLANNVQYIEPIFAFDVTDDRYLVGGSDNVFVGKVITQCGSKTRYGNPQTQFTVDVIDNIKGDLTGEVTVCQSGGYRNDILTIVKGDKLLEPGKSYLFASRFSKEDNWYYAAPIYGKLEISERTPLNGLMNRFEKAYEQQVIQFPNK